MANKKASKVATILIEPTTKTETKERFIASLVVILIAAAVFGIMSQFISDKPKMSGVNIDPKIDVNGLSKAVDNKQAELDKLKEFKHVEIYEKGLATPRSLIDACKLDGTNQDTCNAEIAKITKRLITNGEISEAKLYIKAGVSRGNSPLMPLTQYDSLWVFLDDSNIAGHLLRSKALYSGLSEEGLTELVFDMSNLPITTKASYSEENPYTSKDALRQLNSKTDHFINSFVATEGFGKIENLIIYYTGEATITVVN